MPCLPVQRPRDEARVALLPTHRKRSVHAQRERLEEALAVGKNLVQRVFEVAAAV